jgi:hypothetical protein
LIGLYEQALRADLQDEEVFADPQVQHLGMAVSVPSLKVQPVGRARDPLSARPRG